MADQRHDKAIRAYVGNTVSDVLNPNSLIGAILAVLDQHAEHSIYNECGHSHVEGDPQAVSVREIGLTCELEFVACVYCCTDGDGHQTEDCACYHTHHRSGVHCLTVAEIAKSLGVSDEHDESTRDGA